MKDINPEVLKAALNFEGVTKKDTDSLLSAIQRIQEMGDDERMLRVDMLTEEDIGKTIFIKNRSVSGGLNDIHKMSFDKYFLSINSKIHHLGGWDVVIVKNSHQNQNNI